MVSNMIVVKETKFSDEEGVDQLPKPTTWGMLLRWVASDASASPTFDLDEEGPF
ncbi:hypothetical protein ANCCAN_08893 [Ancylostoma caninum]|uniref:Uncharacterized protein n=1 Tax=Ancylostoma caninum TaxID=29170 RepID=A0A368GL32_ANCCA|nr:hypothetical protein ANCCAN_08893 [Ancylostoma caninum]